MNLKMLLQYLFKNIINPMTKKGLTIDSGSIMYKKETEYLN